jgi:hypothetical protein
MAFPDDILSNTPAKYLFRLVSATDIVTCNPEPLEWKSGSLEVKRDLEVGGVFTSFLCDSLTFVGNGAKMLKDLFEAYELNAKCTLRIYWWKSATRAYVEFPNSFDVNFNFYETVKVGKFNFGVRVKAINSSVQTKLDNRQDIDIDITKLKSIGNFNITDYNGLLKGLHYDATDIFYYAKMLRSLSGFQLNHINGTISYTSIPLNKVSSQFLEIQTVEYVTKQTNLLSVPSFFKDALYNYDELVIRWAVEVNVTDRYVGSFPWFIHLLETDPAGTIIETYDLGGFGGLNQIYYLEGTKTVKCDKGNSLKFVIYSPGINATYSAYFVFQRLEVTQKVASSPSTLTEGFPLYEATERILQHVLDVQYPFYSDFFGRTGIIYNSSAGAYIAENQLRFAHIQSGLNQRGLNLYDPALPESEGSSLVLNFKDLFKSLKAIWNIGYSIETLSGENYQRVRIEEYAHFFQDVEVLDLSSRINKYDIQSAVMPELVPNDLKSGFDSFEYLSANGRAEPNTTNRRTSIMNTATKFENISPLRGDTKGILDNLSTPITEDETRDIKGDSDIFIIKTQVDATYDWKPEKAENISVDNGSSLFKDDLLNRYFTPSRMLIRQGNRIKSGMTKLDAASVLRFQKTDKDSSLETTGTAGIDDYTIIESDDILVSSMADPIFKPMKHTIECLFTQTDLELLSANPLGYLTFSDTISGYLLSLKKKNNEDKAELTIIEKYIPPVS